MKEKYKLREEMEGDIIKYLNRAPSRMYDTKSVKNNIDNCDCPGCPCADANNPAIVAVGVGVLAAATGVLVIAVAADAAD